MKRKHLLIIVMDQEIGIHQTLPGSPWLVIIFISLLVATFASIKDLSSGNMCCNATLILLENIKNISELNLKEKRRF